MHQITISYQLEFIICLFCGLFITIVFIIGNWSFEEDGDEIWQYGIWKKSLTIDGKDGGYRSYHKLQVGISAMVTTLKIRLMRAYNCNCIKEGIIAVLLLSSVCWFLALCTQLVGMSCTNCLQRNSRNKRLFCIFSSVLSIVSGAFSIVAICFWMVRYVFDFETTHKELKEETLTGTNFIKKFVAKILVFSQFFRFPLLTL